MDKPKPSGVSTVIQIVCIAVGVITMLATQRALGYDGILWSTLFGAIGGGVGGGVGALIGAMVAKRD